MVYKLVLNPLQMFQGSLEGLPFAKIVLLPKSHLAANSSTYFTSFG